VRDDTDGCFSFTEDTSLLLKCPFHLATIQKVVNEIIESAEHYIDDEYGRVENNVCERRGRGV